MCIGGCCCCSVEKIVFLQMPRTGIFCTIHAHFLGLDRLFYDHRLTFTYGLLVRRCLPFRANATDAHRLTLLTKSLHVSFYNVTVARALAIG
jgi:hypothetical protein